MKPDSLKTHKLPVLLGMLALSSLLTFMVVHITQGSPAAALPPAEWDNHVLPHREIGDGAESPNISYIESPSPTCVHPQPGTGACYITWNYLYVAAASGQYIISMTIAIDNQVRAYHAGFFQNFMYIPGDMMGSGFRVDCGPPGSGDLAIWGNTYNYTIRARETGGLGAANYGSVTCPADIIRLYLPVVIRP